MKKYLVTGGCGFIGSNYIKYLFRTYQKDICIVNLDSLTYAGNLQNLASLSEEKGYIFIRGDVCDGNLVQNLFDRYNFDYLVNFAAESHVDRSILDPQVFVRTNVLGTQTLLSAAKNAWLQGADFVPGKKFLQVSTDEVYGSLGVSGYFTESTPLNPHSPYSATKASADMLVKAYFDTFQMPVNITRCSNNYGPYQFPEKLIPLIIHRCNQGEDIPVYGDGKNIRDWLYVEDHCSAIEFVLRKAVSGEIYNIGGNNEKQNIEIANIIMTLIGNINSTITYVQDRKGHDRRYAIDSTKIQKQLGWKPKVNFDEGIANTVEWYEENMAWLKSVISKEYQQYVKEIYG